MTWKRTYASDRELEPEDEDGLEGEIPGEVVEDDAESEAFREVEEAEDDPVREPLDVIGVARALERLDGEIGGKSPAHEIRDRRRKRVDGVENSKQDDGTEESVALGHLSALLEGVQDGILGELAGESCD